VAQPPDEVRDPEAGAPDPVEGIETKRLDDAVEAGLYGAVSPGSGGDRKAHVGGECQRAGTNRRTCAA
jgi:hypothetical protein